MTREEAIKILSTRDNQGMPITWQNGFVEAYDMAIEALERKHGMWIKQRNEYWGVVWYECSVCGHKPPNNQFGQEWHSNYCCNCGADMRGKESE